MIIMSNLIKNRRLMLLLLASALIIMSTPLLSAVNIGPPFVPYNDTRYTKCVGPNCPPALITGVVYIDDINNYVANAYVEVECNNIVKNATTNPVGVYQVTYYEGDCQFTDIVTVFAEKEGMTGEATGVVSVDDYKIGNFKIDIAMINVPLIPEFGILVGSLTVVSAIMVFLFIRKR